MTRTTEYSTWHVQPPTVTDDHLRLSRLEQRVSALADAVRILSESLPPSELSQATTQVKQLLHDCHM